MAPVERVDAGHVSVVQFEVEDVEVVPNALRVDRLGDGDEAALEVSAQDDLDHALFVLARELLQGGVGENPALGDGAPRLGDDALRLVEGPQLLLLHIGVQLDRVDSGDDAAA